MAGGEYKAVQNTERERERRAPKIMHGKHVIRSVCWFHVLGCFLGCHMTAPIHVWKKPQLATGGSVRVAIAPVGGANAVAEKLEQAMVVARPQAMQNLAVYYPAELERAGGIQLVAYDGQPSEMGAFGAAKRVGAQYLLAAEVVSHHLEVPEPASQGRAFDFIRRKSQPETLTVRWTVYDAQSGKRLGDKTICMDRLRAEREYPDLAYQSSGELKVIAASARRSWELLVPTTHVTDVVLDLPWFMPGSTRVRRGNAYARQGRWDLAEREWQEAADVHPWNRAAWHNLSLAAVANEDFELAKGRLQHAKTSLVPGDETARTAALISSLESEYRDSFQVSGR
jgi:hypothetical protein